MPWVPALGALICLAQMAGLPWSTWERLFLWLAPGMVIYLAYGRRRAIAARALLAADRAAARVRVAEAARG